MGQAIKKIVALSAVILNITCAFLNAQAINDIHIWPDGSKILAVGDRGLALQSVDGGVTWHETQMPSRGNFECISASPQSRKIMVLGGNAVPGYPGGTGQGLILESINDAQSFKSLAVGPAGWLYAGVFAKARAAIAGQAAHTALGGMFTTAGGNSWLAVKLKQRGYVLGGSFNSWKFGYLVGNDRHIISLENLLEPEARKPQISSPLPLSAVAFQASGAYWTAGENASVLKSGKDPESPWQVIPMPINPGSLLASDFKAIDFLGDTHCAIAGGLIGSIYISTNGGRDFSNITAPPKCCVNSIRWLDRKTLIAGGDGGIWLTKDLGKTWQNAYGRTGCDVLIVASACDETIWPVINLHSAAGLKVGVLFATSPQTDGLPPSQQLRAAALAAGASAVYVLGDFPSVAYNDFLGKLHEKDIVQKWDALLDVDSVEQLSLQIAAAIMKYQPAVVITGPIEPGHKGQMAEVAIVARCTGDAVKIAADDKKLSKAVALSNHTAERLFTAHASNYKTALPWQQPTRPTGQAFQLRLLTTLIAKGKSAPLGFYAQLSNWMTGRCEFPHQLPEQLLYSCPKLGKKKLTLATQGLPDFSEARAKFERITSTEKLLNTNQLLAMSEAQGRTSTLIPMLVGICVGENKDVKTPGFDAKMLASDMLATLWFSLADQGKIVESLQAMEAFERFGQHHPLHQAMEIATLCSAASSEFRAMIAHSRNERPMPVNPQTFAKPVNKFLRMHPWCDGPAGLAEQKHLANLLNRPGDVERAIKLIIETDFSPAWTAWAKTEWAIRAGGDFSAVKGKMFIKPQKLEGKFTLDGRLREFAWEKAKSYVLVDENGQTQPDSPTVKILRTSGELAVGIEATGGRAVNNKISIAFDTDRDTWTQQVISIDSAGDKSSKLLTKAGPAWVSPKTDFKAKQYVSSYHTFEAVIPMKFFDVNPGLRYWAFQIRVIRDAPEGRKVFYLNAQADPQLLPHRYGMLILK